MRNLNHYKQIKRVRISDIFKYELIEETVKNKKMSYIDAILWYCEKNGVDPSDSKKLVNKALKEKLTYEAQSLNLLKEKVAQLPV